MASVNGKKTRARQELDIALGEKPVLIDGLSPEEFDTLLVNFLGGVDLREIRGFKPLKELITFRDRDCIWDDLGVRTLQIDDQTTFVVKGKIESPFDLDTHVLWACRGYLSSHSIYRRHESNEETSDFKVAQPWGQTGYLHRGTNKVLVIRRSRDHARANENLFVVTFYYEKVTLKREHRILEVKVEQVTMGNFRSHFGTSYPAIGKGLISEVAIAYSRTERQLESQLQWMREKREKAERLSSALYCSRDE